MAAAGFAQVDSLSKYVVPLLTPYAKDGSVDFAAMRFNVEHTLRIPGCTAVYFGSIYQELWLLTEGERHELLEVVIDQVAGRVPVVAGLSSPSAAVSSALLKRAQQAGADVLMLWPPTWGPRDRAGVMTFYREVLQEAELPTFVYSSTLSELDFHLDVDAIGQLAEEFQVIAGVKDGTGSLTHFLALVNALGDRLSVSAPREEFYAVARQVYTDKAAPFLFGSARAMYMQSESRPILRDSIDWIDAGDSVRGIRALDQVRGLIDAHSQALANGAHPITWVKYACYLMGQHTLETRAPMPVLGEGARARLVQLLEEARLIPVAESARPGPV
jgi:4-hydroxy-tetrahydrodipicolinate synthase